MKSEDKDKLIPIDRDNECSDFYCTKTSQLILCPRAAQFLADRAGVECGNEHTLRISTKPHKGSVRVTTKGRPSDRFVHSNPASRAIYSMLHVDGWIFCYSALTEAFPTHVHTFYISIK